MSIHSLAPELLLEIFSLTIPNTPSTSRGGEPTTNAGLLYGKSSRKREFAKLARMAGEEPITQHLRMEGPLRSLLELRRRRAFEQLMTIRHKPAEESKPYQQVAVYAQFRSLHLDAGKFKTEPCPPQVTFHKLERLTLGSIRLSTSMQYIFKPTCMPKLKHLAIWAINYLESFSAVFPQITTLAIFDLNPTKSGPFLHLSDALPLLANLQHLSLGNHYPSFPQVLQCFEGSLLESIHLGIHVIRKYPGAVPKLAEMIERQREDGLQTFVLGQGALLIATNKQTPSLPYLRRLVIYGETEIESPGSNPPILSPVNTPNLTSLALDETDLDYQGFERTFSHILSQISTLAIQDFGRTLGKRSSLNYLDKLPDLRHLLIDSGRRIKQVLLKLKDSHLESLHRSLRQLQEEEELAEFLMDIIDGKIREVRIDQIRIYGGAEAVSLKGMKGSMEWRDDQGSPPFEDFDWR
ncbi:hypothetical protein JCM5353_005608 [Sporobolomyces roseus]